MSFFELAEKRKSIRRLLDKPVEDDKLESILVSIKLAPSAGNRQAYKVVSVRDKEIINKLSEASHGTMNLTGANLVLVFLADSEQSRVKFGERGETLYAIQDATIACCYAMLAATDLGLASVWVGAFDEDKVVDVIGGNCRPVAMLPIGYPAVEPSRPARRPNTEIFHNERLQ